MIEKFVLMVRLPLFLLVSIVMLTAGPALAQGGPSSSGHGSGQTATEKAKGKVCMHHTIVDGICIGAHVTSRSQEDSSVGPHLDLDMGDDVD